jgi:hypothetical protein
LASCKRSGLLFKKKLSFDRAKEPPVITLMGYQVGELLGWVQQWGEQIQEIRPGDVVSIPPGQKHWHGATATTAMTHTAIQEHLDGKPVDWLEQVSDEQYQALKVTQ